MNQDEIKIMGISILMFGMCSIIYMAYDSGNQPVKVHLQGELIEPYILSVDGGHYKYSLNGTNVTWVDTTTNITIPSGSFEIDVEAPARYWKEATEEDNCFWT